MTSDLATVFLAAAGYSALTYTSTTLKGVSFSILAVCIAMMGINLLVLSGFLRPSYTVGLLFVAVLVVLQLFMARFIFYAKGGKIDNPDPGRIYLIINKPHNFTGLLGLIWSGIGGGVSAYVDGDYYWFQRDKGILVKERAFNWYRGKRMLDYGAATPEKMADLNRMLGQKWSLWNNCFTVFNAWHRRWS